MSYNKKHRNQSRECFENQGDVIDFFNGRNERFAFEGDAGKILPNIHPIWEYFCEKGIEGILIGRMDATEWPFITAKPPDLFIIMGRRH